MSRVEMSLAEMSRVEMLRAEIISIRAIRFKLINLSLIYFSFFFSINILAFYSRSSVLGCALKFYRVSYIRIFTTPRFNLCIRNSMCVVSEGYTSRYCEG